VIKPSYRAAGIAGAIGLPVAILGYEYAKSKQAGDFFLFAWSVLILIMPMILTTVDFSYWKENGGRGISVSQLPYRFHEIFTFFIGPIRNRIAIYCASGILSTLLVFIIRDLIGF
jgi:hypothetical protein